MKKILSICSARPNFVKLAAVHHAFAALKLADTEHVIVHTGQHFDPLFSDIFFQQLSIPVPAHNLGIHGSEREEVITRTEEAMMVVLENEQPDAVIVYGDVNGAVGGARAAAVLGVPAAHVEAGLRSFDESMPEELNRIEIDQLADFLFATEQSGVDNLGAEGVKGAIHFAGNTMIDTLIRMLPLIEREPLLPNLPDQFGIVTIHRPSNVDSRDRLMSVIGFLNAVSERCPLILPLHHRTRKSLDSFSLFTKLSGTIKLIDPLGYIPFLTLAKHSAFILTDSGGIQEEATFLKKKCFTLRRNTERPSTIESGSNTLIDPENADDQKTVFSFASQPTTPVVTIPPMWDGKAGERIIAILGSV